MNISKISTNTNFKGYDAAPLSAIHMQNKIADAFFWELEEIAKKADLKAKGLYEQAERASAIRTDRTHEG